MPTNRLAIEIFRAKADATKRAKHCHELRDAITDRLFRAGNLDSRDSRAMVLDYNAALRRYIATAFVLDDDLRLSQYANAMVGEQIMPSVDPTLLWDYWTQARPRALRT